MSEKIEELIRTNAAINESYKTLVSLMKGFVIGCSLIIVLIIGFMINTRSDIATILAVLATKDNISTLKDDIYKEMSRSISVNTYIEIERQRALTCAELFYDFGMMINRVDVHIREEELEKFRTTSIFKLNNNVIGGTTRGT